MILIIATQSPSIKPLPAPDSNCLLLLTQNAVIAVASDSLAQHRKVFALESDLISRGLLERAQQQGTIEVINLTQFVELTAAHHPIIHW